MPNNREWANIVVIGIGLIFIFSNPDMREGALSVLKSMLGYKISTALMALIVWTTGMLALGTYVQLWKKDDITDTVFWFVLAAVVMFVNLLEAERSPNYFRRNLGILVTGTAALSLFINLFSFPLLVEVVLLPVQSLLLLMPLIPAHTELEIKTRRLIQGLALVTPLAMILNSVLHLMLDWHGVNKMAELRAVLLPVWLTATILPLLYVIAAVAAYGDTFAELNSSAATFGLESSRGLKLALASGFRLRINELHRFMESAPIGRAEFTPDELAASITTFRESAAESTLKSEEATARPAPIRRFAALATGPIGEALVWSVESALRLQQTLEKGEG